MLSQTNEDLIFTNPDISPDPGEDKSFCLLLARYDSGLSFGVADDFKETEAGQTATVPVSATIDADGMMNV